MMVSMAGVVVYSVGRVDRIPLGEGRVFRVGGEEVAVFRTREGGVYAVQASCPHRGGPLVDGLVGGRRVICPLHACVFDLATGAPLRADCAPLRCYPVTLGAAGDVLVGVGAVPSAGSG